MSLSAAAPASFLNILSIRASIAAPFSSRQPRVLEYLTRSVPAILALSAPPAFQLRIPSLLEGLWEGVLRAVPKKKTSHRKKRQRFLAGKALKDVTALNKCPGCGNVKRAHLLCPYCVREIRDFWLGKGTKEETNASTKKTESQ